MSSAWRVGAIVLLAAAVVAAGAVTTPVQSAADDLTYVALGDSFTSGPLVLPHDTTHVPEDCGQSTRNYPHVAAAALGVSLVDVSCGGARIEHFSEPQDGLTLGGTNMPQFDALGPEADIVTIGISGNDVGFVGFALACVRFPPDTDPCTPDDAGPDDEMSTRIRETAPELAEAIRDARALAPNARIYLVNYPTSLPDDGVGCYPYVPILDEDMPYLVEKYKEMNAMIAAVAAAEDVTLIDVYTPSIGHDACQVPSIAWVNGVVVVPPSYPAHPNELGLAASGAVVAEVLASDIAAGLVGPAPGGTSADGEAPEGSASDVPAAPDEAVVVATSTGTLPATGSSSTPAVVAVVLAAGALAIRRATTRPRRAGISPED